MRKILFRAKCIDGGNWIYGDLIHRNTSITIGAVDSDGLHELEVDKNTICQYTGLTDKNGNKIWENDIVRKSDVNALGWSSVRNCKVSFDEMGYWLLTTEYGDGYWLGEFAAEQIEVIGNIFDHPELMERMG